MIKTADLKADLLTKILVIGFFIIIGLMPVHGLISTWFISNFGQPELFKAWKEILLLVLLVPATVLMVKDKSIWPRLFNGTINQLILLYVGLNVLLAIFYHNDFQATAVGLVYNLRFLAIFLLVQFLVLQFGPKSLITWASRILTVGILVVVIFGFLQFFVLPDDFLRHFGFGPETILPFLTIDQNSDFVRINSSLRGPNPLGLFMVLAVTIIACWWVKRPNWLKDKTWLLAVLSVMSLVTLFASQSRSAWLGVFVALVVLVWLKFPDKRKLFVGAAAGILVAGVLMISLFSNSDFIQNTVFHVDPGESMAINSSDAHWQANQTAIRDIIKHPLGQGPGSAGPASFYSDSPQIAENYFLQIGQELGLVGLALLVTIFWLVAVNLYRQRPKIWPVVLLASFIGLNVASLFLHVWAQDEIALIWWGLAGMFMNKP